MLSIRTQDRMALVPYDGCFIENYPSYGEKYKIVAKKVDIREIEDFEVHLVLGQYTTKERALEVLDEIQKKLEHVYSAISVKCVYQMPKE